MKEEEIDPAVNAPHYRYTKHRKGYESPADSTAVTA
jgi:hypothetical protein